MNDDFVRREDAIKEIHEELDEVCNFDGSGSSIAYYTEEAIYRAPAADVRPVVRGRWIDEASAYNLYVYHKCSICDKVFSNAPLAVFHYCPNCGADMREVNPDDQR